MLTRCRLWRRCQFLVLLFTYYYNEVRYCLTRRWFYGFTKILVMTFCVCFDAYTNHVNKKEFLNGESHSGFPNAKDGRNTQKVLLCVAQSGMIIWTPWSSYSSEAYYGQVLRREETIHPCSIVLIWWNRLNHRSSHRYMVISSQRINSTLSAR